MKRPSKRQQRARSSENSRHWIHRGVGRDDLSVCSRYEQEWLFTAIKVVPRSFVLRM